MRRIGYAPLRRVVELFPGLERTVSLALEPVAVRLDSVTVTTAPDAIAIEGTDLVRRGGDLARALDGWEGVVVRRAGNGRPPRRSGAAGPTRCWCWWTVSRSTIRSRVGRT